jgi:hypothetical protein
VVANTHGLLHQRHHSFGIIKFKGAPGVDWGGHATNTLRRRTDVSDETRAAVYFAGHAMSSALEHSAIEQALGPEVPGLSCATRNIGDTFYRPPVPG